MGSEGWGEECMFRGVMEKKLYFSGMELDWGGEWWDVMGRGGCR